jgi:predicted dehydrogenase
VSVGQRPLRLAIVGAGWAGSRQADAATELGRDIEIVALVDSDREFLAERAAALRIRRTYDSLDQVLGVDEIDAVSICTPHSLHAEMAIASAGAGKHVLVEKPMAMTVIEAQRMADAADAAGVVLFVAESEVYRPYVRHLRNLVEQRTIGELTFAALVSGYRAPSPAYPGRRAWLTRPEEGGTGSWFLQGVHALSALRHVLGEVATVFVREHRTASWERPDLEATMSALLVLESGLDVWFVQTTETQVPRAIRGFQLYGERGVIIGGSDGYEHYRTGDAADGDSPVGQVERHTYPDPGLSAYALELESFARAVRGEPGGPTSGRSEIRTIAILEAGLESAKTGGPVDLRARFPDAFAWPS